MLDADLLEFIRASIRSTWSLELVLLMRRHAGREMTNEALVKELRATPTLIDNCLTELFAAGLVAPSGQGSWRYAPASADLERACAALEQAYQERPVGVINAILTRPNDRLQTFANAFRFTKKDE